MVYLFAAAAAAVVATGEAVQQRLAARAPPAETMSIRLLWWLAGQPRWLVGVGCSLMGNVMFALAVSAATVVRAESVFAVRLLFALLIAAALRRSHVPGRDLRGAAMLVAGLATLLIAANPRPPHGPASAERWAIAAATLSVIVAGAWSAAHRLGQARRATLLGGCAGMLFGAQAALTRAADRIIAHGGPAALFTTWQPYALVVAALTGMVLVQNAFESAPLAASYPAVVTGQLMTSIVLGVTVLGVVADVGVWHLAASIPALGAMLVGIFVLTRSHLVVNSTHDPDSDRPAAHGHTRGRT